MKKLFLAVTAIVLLMVTSCSKSASNTNNQTTNGLVPKTIVQKDKTGKVINTVTFTYDGNKLLEAANTAKMDGVSAVKFTYTSDKITKYDYIRLSSTNDNVNIEYNTAGKPSKISGSAYTNIGHLYGDYTYNSDGSVTINRANASTTTLTYSGDNLLKVVKTTAGSSKVTEYEYDTNNHSAFKNVKGMEYFRDFGYVSDFYQLPGSAFVTKMTGAALGWGSMENTYTATFNSDKLPTKVTDKNGNTYEITY